MLGRFEAGRRLYNAVLDEALKRLGLMRQSKAWQVARSAPKGKARNQAFKDCNTCFGFSEYALHSVATTHKNAAGFADRLGAHETQKIGTRVWKVVSAYAFGARGRPRFKGGNRPLHSLEGKNNVTGIRWNADTGCVTWGTLALPVKLPTRDQDPYGHAALKSGTKYCRIVWRMDKGTRRWFVQLVQDGIAPTKYEFLSSGLTVGLDVGPSTIAIVGDEAVGLEQFASGVVQPWNHQRRLQRALDRSRRATRKKEHGALANKILGLGNLIQTEALSYKAFQKNYGRSVKVRAPGMFIERLTRKAESAGGKLVELNTRRLRMSPYDHVSGTCAKKPLSQRWHRLGGDNVIVQRDCYSAFLAKHATADGHSSSRLEEGGAVAEPLLERAGVCRHHQSASRLPKGNPTVAMPSESIARKKRLVRDLNRDVVGRKAESQSAPRMPAFRTPGFSHGEVQFFLSGPSSRHLTRRQGVLPLRICGVIFPDMRQEDRNREYSQHNRAARHQQPFSSGQ